MSSLPASYRPVRGRGLWFRVRGGKRRRSRRCRGRPRGKRLCSLQHALTTAPRTAWTPALIAFRLQFKCCGPCSSAAASLSYPTPPVISSNVENSTRQPSLCRACEASPSHLTSFRTNLPRLSPTTNTNCKWFPRAATGAAGPIASKEVSGNLVPTSAARFWVLRCR